MRASNKSADSEKLAQKRVFDGLAKTYQSRDSRDHGSNCGYRGVGSHRNHKNDNQPSRATRDDRKRTKSGTSQVRSQNVTLFLLPGRAWRKASVAVRIESWQSCRRWRRQEFRWHTW